jgi:hypothetical protein
MGGSGRGLMCDRSTVCHVIGGTEEKQETRGKKKMKIQIGC